MEQTSIRIVQRTDSERSLGYSGLHLLGLSQYSLATMLHLYTHLGQGKITVAEISVISR